jgi:hypothetical protein
MPTSDVKECFMHFIDKFQEKNNLGWALFVILLIVFAFVLKYKNSVHQKEIKRISDERNYYQQLVTTTFEVYQEAAATPAAPTLTVDNLNDSSCSLRIRGSFPVQPDPGTAQISVTKGAVVNMATLVGQEANTPFDFTYETRNNGFPYGDLFTDRIGEGFACNESLDVRLSYKYHGSQVSSTVVNDVITSFVSSKPVIYNLEKYFDYCLIRVSGSFPSSGDVGTRPQVQIYSTEFEKSVTIYPIIDEGTFYIELPLDDFESYNAYDFGPLAEPDGESQVPPGCGDEWEAYAFYTVNNQYHTVNCC